MKLVQNSLFGLFLMVCVSVQAQEKSELVQQRIEFIAEQLGVEEIDLTPFIEILTDRIAHPINLNKTTFEELVELGLLSDVQINDLIIHIKKFGKFISIYELQSLKYWDLQTIELIRPFIYIDERLDQLKLSFREALKQGEFTLITRLQVTPEAKKGFQTVSDSLRKAGNTYYAGGNARVFTRFRYQYRTNISFGVTGEKDPGEQFFKGVNKKQGFDFYSAHAFYKGGKYIRAVALGDYSIQIGQGLNFWSGYSFGKTADVSSVKRSAIPLRPYASADENRFMRGAAVDLGFKAFALTVFGSSKKVDGTLTVQDTTVDEESQFSNEFAQSINVSGLHRTTSEIARKNNLTEQVFGGNLRFDYRRLHIGTAVVNQGFTTPFVTQIQPYNQFDFRGKMQTSASVDYSLVVRNFNFFGETSRNMSSGSLATVNGAIIALDPKASMVVLYRNYSKGYTSRYTAGLGETQGTQNEQGLFVGWKYRFNAKWGLSTYMDFFKSKWLKYLTDAPSNGNELLLQLSYKPNKIMEIYGRFREQVKPRNSRDSDGSITGLEDVRQRNYRLNFSYALNENFTIKSRIEYVTVNRKSNKSEQGFIVYQDLLYKPKGKPVDISLRYALFDTDSYDTRIYAYENQALYTFSIPAYYYKGSRAYALIRYTFLRKFDLWVRYGTFIYANRSTISSGSEEIKGSVKSDITVQLRVKL